ncbi:MULTISPECIES: outer membrane protein [Alphaproteobacteria]|uniref:Outer surface protein n=2 Tax=Alphaproteobacteria TaxID=28211 RepID=A0A512HPC5_9HYPH|nr:MULTISPECIES: outer membrane protein [Alphaproteobacteria]GEO87315.1 outer surface protein [Ciceribacter naphthalenivorans]GLR22757.1 outer surface protein [Ciceribacter naphthalenivorans]GLT05613.1 outer surface protein [Sphingomonas psychrolutea]
MKTSLFVVAAVLLAGTAAHSADIYQPEPVPYEAPEVQVTEASGWYLRGDAGYDFNKLRGAEYFQGSNSNLVDFDDADLKNSFTLGAGVGYQINNYLRTDLTFDYMFKSDFDGSTSGTCGSPLVPCTSSDVAAMRAYTLMANAYVDIGSYGMVTPYVGAGIGGAYVQWDNLKNTACADDGSGCDGEVKHSGRGDWRFAYQLMAGASIDVTCNVKADVGYRFRHTLGGDMFGYNSNGGPGYDKGFYSHEAHVGARYLFGACAEPVAAYEPPPQPLVYK